jgi:hypothetical protein
MCVLCAYARVMRRIAYVDATVDMVHLGVRPCTCVCTRARARPCTCVCTCARVHMYMCMYVPPVHLHTHVLVHTHKYERFPFARDVQTRARYDPYAHMCGGAWAVGCGMSPAALVLMHMSPCRRRTHMDTTTQTHVHTPRSAHTRTPTGTYNCDYASPRKLQTTHA